jgi:hypothetical protein
MRKKRKTPLSRRGLPRRFEEDAELEPYPRIGELVDEKMTKKISQKAAVEILQRTSWLFGRPGKRRPPHARVGALKGYDVTTVVVRR